jgi:CBS-domain-containing membrane protein
MTIAASEIMTSKLVSAPARLPWREAYQLMEERRLQQIPVTDDQHHIIGVLEKKALSPAILSPPPQSLSIGANAVAEDLMTPPEIVRSETPLRTVILLMLQKKISCVLIADASSEVVGLLSTDDLLWYLAHLLKDESAAKSFFSSHFSASQIQTIGEISRELAEIGI